MKYFSSVLYKNCLPNGIKIQNLLFVSAKSLNLYVVCAETITKLNGTEVAQPIQSPSSHDLQIYGIVVTIVLCFIVFGGVKMINRVAPAFLIPVLLSIFCIFVGIFLARKNDPAGKLPVFLYSTLLAFLKLTTVIRHSATNDVHWLSAWTIVILFGT